MFRHGGPGQEEPSRDLAVGEPLGHELQHLEFSRGEFSQPGTGGLHHGTRDLRVDHHSPADHHPQRTDEVRDLRHPVLEEVPGPTRTWRGREGEQLLSVQWGDILAEH